MRAQLALAALLPLFQLARCAAPPILPLSFSFVRSNNTSPPNVLTQQCETIELLFSRNQVLVASGPDPFAPYFLQVHSSNATIPFLIPAGDGPSFKWQVPFPAGTQYQICMFDSRGNTGGCEDTFFVTPPATPATCAGPTGRQLLATLDVDSSIGRFAFPAQCSDITVTPRSGTAPFTLTIAPSLHPPINITSKSLGSITWQVGLSWGSRFYLSLTDARGLMWSFGPIHAGSGATACLDLDGGSRKTFGAAAVGGGVIGGIAAGALISVLVMLLPRARSWRRPVPQLDMIQTPERPSVDTTVTPFVLPTRPLGLPSPNRRSGVSPMSPLNKALPRPPPAERGDAVYVVHHDGGRAPVTVLTARGTTVVELPPTYLASASGSDTVSPSSPDETLSPFDDTHIIRNEDLEAGPSYTSRA